MNPQIVPCLEKGSLREDGMLFVRTQGILPTMVKAPFILAGLIIVSLAIPLQTSFSSTRTLDLSIYPDGSTHVSSNIEIDVLEPDIELPLYGTTIDNFVAVGENGYLLSGEISGNMAKIETFGASNILVDYDTHDLISKEGRIWTFSINSPVDYSILMPKNTVIVGMTALPLNMDMIDEQTQLFLPSGDSEINYFFSVSSPSTSTPPNPTQPTNNNLLSDPIFSLIVIGGTIAIAGTIGAFLMKRKQGPIQKKVESKKTEEVSHKPMDIETVFQVKPDLREDDKELVKFIFDNGGQAYESELRKKFLQPRTTMWRAVKRLERHGIVEIEKKELQNLVKLKKEAEDEQ